jgi:hypothetical protein
MSDVELVSLAASFSSVVNHTRVPSAEARWKNASAWVTSPKGPVEIRLVVDPERSKMSFPPPSNSPGSIGSRVVKNTRAPSAETPLKLAPCAPLPPEEPVEIRVVVEPERS